MSLAYNPSAVMTKSQNLSVSAEHERIGVFSHNTMNIRGITLSVSAIIAAAVIGLSVLLVLDGFVNIPAGHVGVVYDRGKGVIEDRWLPAGLRLKIPFWQQVTIMDTRLQTYTMSQSLSESDLINNSRARLNASYNLSDSQLLAQAPREESNSVDALTSDGQQVTVDISVQYHIQDQSAASLYKSIGLDYADKVIIPAARSITREAITGFESQQLFTEQTRMALESTIKSELTENYANKGITLDDVLIRHVGFSAVYLNAIEEKQIAQQQIQKAQFQQEEAQIRKDTTIIQAQAEAESIRLKGEALRESPEVIQLQFVDKMAPKMQWGILPDGALPLLDLKSLQSQ